MILFVEIVIIVLSAICSNLNVGTIDHNMNLGLFIFLGTNLSLILIYFFIVLISNDKEIDKNDKDLFWSSNDKKELINDKKFKKYFNSLVFKFSNEYSFYLKKNGIPQNVLLSKEYKIALDNLILNNSKEEYLSYLTNQNNFKY